MYNICPANESEFGKPSVNSAIKNLDYRVPSKLQWTTEGGGTLLVLNGPEISGSEKIASFDMASLTIHFGQSSHDLLNLYRILPW